MSKAILRSTMLERRKNLTEEKVAQNSRMILSKLKELLEDKQRVMVYLSFGNEVDTFELLEWLWQQKKRVAVPVCDTKTYQIHPSVLNSTKELSQNRYGILEPAHICIPDFCYDAVIVPGIVFDLAGNRIGFGKGYYDKFLSAQENRPLKIGLCHDFQLLSHIPSESHDIRMNYIISQSRTVMV